MLDRNVIVKAGVTIEPNTIASCLKIVTDSKGQNLSFVQAEEVNEKYFEKGVVCFMPMNLALAPHQFIGAPLPYENKEESELEDTDDDGSEEEDMTLPEFKVQIAESIQQIYRKEFTIDCALINIR